MIERDIAEFAAHFDGVLLSSSDSAIRRMLKSIPADVFDCAFSGASPDVKARIYANAGADATAEMQIKFAALVARGIDLRVEMVARAIVADTLLRIMIKN